jgi:hypothetical protein
MREMQSFHDIMAMICDPESDYVWRIDTNYDGLVSVQYIGFCPIDDRDVTLYDDISKIPDWMQHRVAALNMMPPHPTESSIYGVGRRIDDTVFWVVQ